MHPRHFVGHLLLGAEDMGVVLSKAADARHTAQLARLLIAIHGAEFRQPHRQAHGSCGVCSCRS